jgi:dipeptidyl aminopeptidase/acylaminoacyl peptidase
MWVDALTARNGRGPDFRKRPVEQGDSEMFGHASGVGAIAAWALALALAMALPAAQAAAPAETFYKDPDIAEAVLSPSGRLLAITSAAGLTRVGLVVFDLTQGNKPARVAQFSDGDIWQVRWLDESRLLFGVIDPSQGSGVRTGAPGLYVVDVEGKNLKPLVRRQNAPFVIDGQFDHKLLSWNHRVQVVPRPREGEPNDDVLLAAFATREPYEENLKWLNTRTGRVSDVHVDAPDGTIGWFTDSRGEPRVALTRNKGRQGAYWRGPSSKTWEPLYDSGLLDRPFEVVAVDDAGGLYVTRLQGRGGYAELARYDFEAKAPAAQALVTTPGFDFRGRPLLEYGSGKLLGVRALVDAETTVWLDPGLKALQAEADRLLPGRVNHIDCRRCGLDSMVALVRSYSDHDPGRLWLYRAQPAQGERNWISVGQVMKGVDPKAMAGLELHRIKARDGLELPVWVTRSDDTKGALPAVVLVHGGPWVRGTSWDWHPDAQFLASRGYVVIEPEMRGSTGYGEAHFRAGFKQFGLAMQDDVADALRWAQSKGLANDRACIAGASYGGYSTLMGLIKDPGLYRCGVAWVALADLDLYLSGSWWVSDNISDAGRRYTLPEMVGDPDKDAAMIAANSPVRQAARLKAPLLLVFGEADRRVPLAHGERLRKALIEAGNPPEWVTYPGEGHGFSVVKNRVDFAQRMESFFARHLLGP